MKTTTDHYADAHAEIARLEAQVSSLKVQVEELKAKLRKRSVEKSGSFYEITPLSPDSAGGWNLRFIREGVEVGETSFPVRDGADEIDAYNDAMEAAHNWLEHELDITMTSSEFEVMQRSGGGWTLRLFCDHTKIGEVVFPVDSDVHCIDAYDKAGCEQAREAGRHWMQEMNKRHPAQAAG